MPAAPASTIAAFRALHAAGCFVIPNPWDIGSARLLAGMGFKALASTSAGAAWALGRPDGGVALADMLEHLAMLAGATDLPVNADFQNGFADAPDGVAENVARAVATGVAGLSIEDSTGRAADPLYDVDLAVARVAAARKAIDQSGSGVLLTARAEGFLAGRPDLGEVIARLKAFSAAGADCLYAPFLPDLAAVTAVVQAAAPKPVNALISGPIGASVPELAAAGVRRVSTGGALAYAAWAGFLGAARAIQDDGKFAPFGSVAPFKNLNAAFADPTGPAKTEA